MDHPYHSVANGILFNEKFHNYLKKSEIEKFFDTNCENSFLSPNKNFLKKFDLLNTSINIGIKQLDKNYKKRFSL